MKDPAALLYIDKWLVSTKGMKGNAKGWYLNLILYQYDKGELPNDIEELANLCDVRISEFEEFKQVFKQVLKQKFIVNDNGCLQNEFANEILRKRETFKEKRSEAGKLGYVIKYYRNNYKHKEGFEEYLKENLVIDFDIKNNQMLKQVLKQNYKLYININKDKDINKDNIINKKVNKKEIDISFVDIDFLESFKKWLNFKKENKQSYKSQMTLKTCYENLLELSGNNPEIAAKIINQSIANNWAGLFPLKNNINGSSTRQIENDTRKRVYESTF